MLSLPLFSVLFQIGSLFGDFELIMKIVGLLFIVSFVKQHIQHPILSNVLILGLSAFLLFDFWKVFGGALFLFILVSFGVLHIMVDLSFLGAFQRHPSREEMEHAQREQEAQQRSSMRMHRRAGNKENMPLHATILGEWKSTKKMKGMGTLTVSAKA